MLQRKSLSLGGGGSTYLPDILAHFFFYEKQRSEYAKQGTSTTLLYVYIIVVIPVTV